MFPKTIFIIGDPDLRPKIYRNITMSTMAGSVDRYKCFETSMYDYLTDSDSEFYWDRLRHPDDIHIKRYSDVLAYGARKFVIQRTTDVYPWLDSVKRYHDQSDRRRTVIMDGEYDQEYKIMPSLGTVIVATSDKPAQIPSVLKPRDYKIININDQPGTILQKIGVPDPDPLTCERFTAGIKKYMYDELSEKLSALLRKFDAVVSGSIIQAIETERFKPGDIDIYVPDKKGVRRFCDSIAEIVGNDYDEQGVSSRWTYESNQSDHQFITQLVCISIQNNRTYDWYPYIQVIGVAESAGWEGKTGGIPEFINQSFDLPFLKSYYDGKSLVQMYERKSEYTVNLDELMRNKKKYYPSLHAASALKKLQERLKRYRKRGFVIYDKEESVYTQSIMRVRRAFTAYFISDICDLIVEYTSIGLYQLKY